MKKFLLLTCMLISAGIFEGQAEKQEVLMTIHKKGQEIQNTTVKRTSMQLPVEIIYDSEAGIVEITGDDELEAQVSLTDESGNTLASSPTINTVFEVPTGYTGILLIYIETEDWTATGEIEI